MEARKEKKLSKEELKFLKAMQFVDVFGKRNKKKEKDGFIYLVKDNASNLVKIGITTNHVNRLKSLNTMVPLGVTTIAVIPSKRYESLEKEVHERYKHKRRNGEWFDFNDDDVKSCLDFIKNNDVR
ncbi:GIY-YIG nuclease family protein [Virgibacillus sp. AGTR]|uniref:GIY-YIG nuclease family protein n=1 Tax=Virgibacillus sp. AGTR TaxID=2812055 RepID=UPI001D16DFBC|nr:GIY-YIG nuclease family protein [Virgibacillus sp. AGTR]MCC2250067.1 GIY-YIG nuclease family protein [Virgibacillus sp. AGTR]